MLVTAIEMWDTIRSRSCGTQGTPLIKCRSRLPKVSHAPCLKQQRGQNKALKSCRETALKVTVY